MIVLLVMYFICLVAYLLWIVYHLASSFIDHFVKCLSDEEIEAKRR